MRRAHPSPSFTPAEDGADDVPEAPLLLRQGRVAEVLDVSESTVSRLVRSGQLPAVRLGGSTRIRVADLEAFVERLGEENEDAN